MAEANAKKGGLLVISGFSGVGKGTVIRRLMEEFPEYAFSVSATTRKPRPGETHGTDYFFIDPETFDRWVEEGKFLEYARFFDKAYGTLAEHVEDLRNQGKTVILDVEVEGACNIMKSCPDAVSVYIIPPSAGELHNRLKKRATESEDQIRGRMEKAVREADIIPQYHHIVVNDEVQDTAEEIHQLAQGTGKTRLPRRKAMRLARQIQKDLARILEQ